MATVNTNTAPILVEGSNITLTQSGQTITIASSGGGGGGTPGGSTTQVQFNDAGAFAGDAGLTYDKTNNVLAVESIDFATTPTAANAVGRTQWDNDEGSLVLTLKGGNITIPIGQEVVTLAYNSTGTTLSKGEIVRVSGAQGQRIAVSRAYNTNDDGSAMTLGMVAETILSGAEGFVMIYGVVRGIDTDGYAEGDSMYLGSTAGTWTDVKPSAPEHLVYVGFIVKVHPSSGEIFVRVQNGYELHELHNVAIASVADKNMLIYDNATSLWKNSVTLSTDGTMASNSDTLIPSQKAAKTYTDTAIAAVGTLNAGGKLYLFNAY